MKDIFDDALSLTKEAVDAQTAHLLSLECRTCDFKYWLPALSEAKNRAAFHVEFNGGHIVVIRHGDGTVCGSYSSGTIRGAVWEAGR
jgi:hypothetical protein